MTIYTLVFLALVLAEILIAVRLIIQFATGKRGYKGSLAAGAVLALIYTLTLLAVGINSKPTIIPIGQEKCFDDWCFVVKGSRRTKSGIEVQAASLNQGRRAQAPDSPQLFAIVDGRTAKLDCPTLRDRVDGHSENPISLTVSVPADAKDIQILVTEGGGPSALIIDDENSPFHAKSTWQVSP